MPRRVTPDDRPMTVGEQMRYWGLGLVVFVLMLWVLADALLPFVLGAAIAYLTDPLADRLERAGFSRTLSTVIITVGALALGAMAFLLIVPTLIDQVRQAISHMPEYVEQAKVVLNRWLPDLSQDGSLVRRAMSSLGENAKEWSAGAIAKLWSGSVAIVDFLALIVITPVVAFYMLHDWDRIVAAIDDILPREHRDVIHKLMGDLDTVLAGFLRGQLTVCAILGVFYAVALSLIGLDFGMLIGLFAGLISFIPFVGSIIGGLLSIGVAIAQFWGQPEWILAVAAVFVAGQAVEGNFLTPKLVGDKVGLHPVWLMFALSAFGSLFGFVGLLVAVPAAAGIGVMARFLTGQYKDGRLYQGSRDWQRKVAEAPVDEAPHAASQRDET
ncbi:MAG: AI-2E family transporter [Pseudomonadota bacterium]